MGNEVPVGGRLLYDVLDSFLEPYVPRDGHIDIDKAREQARKNVLEAVAGCRGRDCWRRYLGSSLRLANDMLGDLVGGLAGGGHGFCSVLDLGFVLRSPGLVGVGSGLFRAIFEVGLQMDWLLGLPYYPGSTLKGAVRDAARSLLLSRGRGEDEVEGVLGSVFGRSGGEESMAGLAVFFDAYPVGCERGGRWPCLVLTGGVVTPHYYKGGVPVEAESDAMPSPVQHVVIAPGTVFRVVAGVNCERGLADEDRRKIGVLIEEVLGKKGCEGQACYGDLAIALGVLTVYALNRGFAARSGKGYNVMEPYSPEDVVRDVVALKVYVPAPESHPQGHRKGPRPGHHPPSPHHPRGRHRRGRRYGSV